MTLSAARPCRLFLFDLDGTLIDSRADIAYSVNLALASLNLPPLPESRVVDFVGNGLRKLIERTLRETAGCEPESGLVQKLVSLFREEYGNHLLDRTCLCPHVKEALDRLPWAKFAVVSNKPEIFCRRILEGLRLADRLSLILGGDSIQNQKPHPEPLQKAMEFCKAPSSETVMVGDSPVDMEAGKAAGITTCGVLGGFRPQRELEAAGCDLVLKNLLELADYFCPPK